MREAPDAAIARLARQEGLIVVTKDEDFVALQRSDILGIVWLRCGNITDAGLLALVEPQWAIVVERLAAGHRLIELR